MKLANKHVWNTHEAKDNLSKLLLDAQSEAQVITRYGKPFAVVSSYEEYKSKETQNETLWDYFKDLAVEESLEPIERTEIQRDVEL